MEYIRKKFLFANYDYPGEIRDINISVCSVDDNAIPSYKGEINSEEYTFGQLRFQPITPEIIRNIAYSGMRLYAIDCNRRNSLTGFSMYKIEDRYCFWALRVGPVLKKLTIENINDILHLRKISEKAEINNNTIDIIKNVEQKLLIEIIASDCGISEEEAETGICFQLHCILHEDISGFVFMIPEWAYKWFNSENYKSYKTKKAR